MIARLEPLASWFWLALIISLQIGSAAAADAQAPESVRSEPSFFGSVEIQRENLGNFPKWTGMMERQRQEAAVYARGCTSSTSSSANNEYCAYGQWLDYLKSLKGRSFTEQMEAVNSYMNRHPYVPDIVNWNTNDYWETPGEFLAKDGDCEDYAIAKLFSLRLLGHTDTDLRIAVVQDMNLNVAHAILVVRTSGKTWILDNQIKHVVDAASVYHYRPIYSINEHHWWLHRVN